MDLRISLINRGSVALCSPVWRLHRHQEQGRERDDSFPVSPPLPFISIVTNEGAEMGDVREKIEGG